MPWIRIESTAYWVVFVASFLGVAIWESFRPKYNNGRTERRWGKHGTLIVITNLVMLALYRVSPVVMAVNAASNRFGLLNKNWLPYALRLVAAVLLLDFVRYVIHRAEHSMGLLWRVHQVHHSDPGYDVSTGLRVHPIEVALAEGANLLAVAILAPPVVAVLIVELATSMQSFFSHANASLPGWADKPMRMLFVTPDMHRIHHSEDMTEQFKNLGDIFPWWDRLLGTYAATPAAGEDGIVTGLKGFQNDRSLELGFMLAQPFRSEPQPTVPVDARAAGA